MILNVSRYDFLVLKKPTRKSKNLAIYKKNPSNPCHFSPLPAAVNGWADAERNIDPAFSRETSGAGEVDALGVGGSILEALADNLAVGGSLSSFFEVSDSTAAGG